MVLTTGRRVLAVSAGPSQRLPELLSEWNECEEGSAEERTACAELSGGRRQSPVRLTKKWAAADAGTYAEICARGAFL